MPTRSQLLTEFETLCGAIGRSSTQQVIQSAFSISKAIDGLIIKQSSHTLALNYALNLQPKLNANEQAICRLLTFAHICRLNQLNSTVCHLLNVSLVLVLATEHLDESRKEQARKHLMRHFKAMRYDLACSIMQIGKLLYIPDPLKYIAKLKLNQWQWFAVCASVLTRYHNKLSWPEKLSRLLLSLPSEISVQLQGLINYPSFCPPGATVIYQQQLKVVVHVLTSKLVLINDDELITIDSAACTYCEQNEFKQSLFSSALKHLEVQPLFPPAYKIDRPPRSLTKVLKQCHQPDVNIDKLSASIEAEASFASFIRESATANNRLKLNVSSVKQAVMTYGSGRLGDMLTTHALFERLTQHNFPLKQRFIQHVSLCSALASELAKLTNIMLPQTASLIVLMCHSALFTEVQFKTAATWQIDENEFGFASFKGLGIEKMRSVSITLAKSWALESANTALIGLLLVAQPRLNRKSVSLIILALIWSKAAQNGSLCFLSNNNKIESQLMKQLKLSQDDKSRCLENSSHQLYCELAN